MKYQGVCIAVSDVKTARKFYEDLFGLEVYQDYGLCVMFNGGLSLQQDFDWIVGIPKDSMKKQPHNMELYFEDDDFDGFALKLKSCGNIKLLHDVKEQRWGQRSISFYDLDGHIIEVGENSKAVVMRFINSGMTLEETSKRMDISVLDLEKLLK